MGDHFTHQKGREALVYISEHGLLQQYRRATGSPPTPLALAYSWVQSHKLSQAAQHTLERHRSASDEDEDEFVAAASPTHTLVASRWQAATTTPWWQAAQLTPTPWSDGEIELPKIPNRPRFEENEYRPQSSLPAGFCFFDPAYQHGVHDEDAPQDFLEYLPRATFFVRLVPGVLARERRATRFISKQRKRLAHIKWLRRRGSLLVETFENAAEFGLLHSTTPAAGPGTTQGKLLSDRYSWEGEVLQDLDESLQHVSRLYTFSRTVYASTETLGLVHVPELRADHFELPTCSTSGWLHTPLPI